MEGEKKPGEYIIQLLKEITQLKQEREQLKKRIRELEPECNWIKYAATDYFN